MKSILSVLAAFMMLAFGAPLSAQTTGDIIRDAVFTEVEKRVIQDYFGKKVNTQGATKEDDEDDRDDTKDDDDDGDKKGKDKKKKNKGKSKSKNKGKSGQMPPGLAKRDNLPPGLQKQLEKNGTLPPGLAKRDLPADLKSKLPRRPSSQEVAEVDGNVVLMDKATGVILDVLKDVVRGKAGGGADTGSGSRPSSQPGPQSDAQPDNRDIISKILDSLFGGGNG